MREVHDGNRQLVRRLQHWSLQRMRKKISSMFRVPGEPATVVRWTMLQQARAVKMRKMQKSRILFEAMSKKRLEVQISLAWEPQGRVRQRMNALGRKSTLSYMYI